LELVVARAPGDLVAGSELVDVAVRGEDFQGNQGPYASPAGSVARVPGAVESFSYDARGNMVEWRRGGALHRTFDWYALDRLTEVAWFNDKGTTTGIDWFTLTDGTCQRLRDEEAAAQAPKPSAPGD